jgi:hypothetical protein
MNSASACTQLDCLALRTAGISPAAVNVAISALRDFFARVNRPKQSRDLAVLGDSRSLDCPVARGVAAAGVLVDYVHAVAIRDGE